MGNRGDIDCDILFLKIVCAKFKHYKYHLGYIIELMPISFSGI